MLRIQRIPTFDVDLNSADSVYLGHAMRSDGVAAQLAGATTGLGQHRQRVSVDDFLAITLPLPDIEKQRLIGAHLDSLRHLSVVIPGDRGVSDLRQAWLASAFTDKSASAPLGEVAVLIRGSELKLSSAGVGAIGQAAVRWDGIEADRLKQVDADWEASRLSEKRTQQDDILLNSTGEGTIGRACLVRDSDVLASSLAAKS